MQGIESQKEGESSGVDVQVAHAGSRAGINSNRAVDSTDLRGSTEKRGPKQY
jgi:hypothetical protein